MTVLNSSRILDLSETLETDAGEELEDFITTTADFVEQSTRAINNGLNYKDNFRSDMKNVELQHDTDQVIYVKSAPYSVSILKIIKEGERLTEFGWWSNSEGNIVVHANFSSGAGNYPCDLMILYL